MWHANNGIVFQVHLSELIYKCETADFKLGGNKACKSTN